VFFVFSLPFVIAAAFNFFMATTLEGKAFHEIREAVMHWKKHAGCHQHTHTHSRPPKAPNAHTHTCSRDCCKMKAPTTTDTKTSSPRRKNWRKILQLL